MPTAQPSKPFVPCPEGEDILFILKAVEETVNPPEARFNPGQTQWKWVFETAELEMEDGQPYRIVIFTGTNYGDERARLTQLIDRIGKSLTLEQKQTFDTDWIVGKTFVCDVIHKARPDGTVRAEIDHIKRLPTNSNGSAQPRQIGATQTKTAPKAAPLWTTPARPVADEEDEGEPYDLSRDPFADEA